MTDLQTLLERAVEPDGDFHVDVSGDLRRGRSALRRRRRAVTAGGVSAVLVLGGAAAGLARSSGPGQRSHAVDIADAPAVRAGAFEVPTPPDGWRVQAADESMVVIAPDGLPKVDLHDPRLQLRVTGKLVVEYLDRTESLREGRPIEYDGRDFYHLSSAGVPVRVSVKAPSGDWLVLQTPVALHWTMQDVVRYLDGVRPGADAVAR